MRHPTFCFALATCLSLLLCASALAGDDAKAAAARPDEGSPGDLAPGGDASSLSPQEMVAKADGMLTQMRESLKDAFAEVAEVKKQNDVDRLNTVNAAVTALKGLVQRSEQSHVALQEAAAKGDRASAEHEYTKIAIAYKQSQELDAQVQAAAAQAGGPVEGQTETAVEERAQFDSSLPAMNPDTTVSVPFESAVAEPPAPTSPFF